jgi:hypothetical protein
MFEIQLALMEVEGATRLATSSPGFLNECCNTPDRTACEAARPLSFSKAIRGQIK